MSEREITGTVWPSYHWERKTKRLVAWQQITPHPGAPTRYAVRNFGGVTARTSNLLRGWDFFGPQIVGFGASPEEAWAEFMAEFVRLRLDGQIT